MFLLVNEVHSDQDAKKCQTGAFGNAQFPCCVHPSKAQKRNRSAKEFKGEV